MAESKQSGAAADLERPMPFIEWSDDDDEFHVNEDAVAYLSSLSGHVAVVAVAGKYRTGKSYLLNLLADQPTAFEVGPTVQACTKGIWLWGKALRVEGRNMNVLFLDTEGLDSTDRDATFDSRLFALTLLLCSTFVFNAVGSINGEEINKLSLVVNLTKVIHTKREGGGDDSGQEYASFFPHFIYLIRDFMLELERDGQPLTPNEYLEDALMPEETLEDEGMARNDIRDAVRSFFPKRDCFTLVRPVSDEEKLADLSKIPYTDLRDEFRHGIEAMKRRLFSALEVKSVYGRPLNGAMLCSLAQAYVSALNSSGTPTISTAWERVVASQCERAVEQGYKAYMEGMAAAASTAGPAAGAGAGAGSGARSGASGAGVMETDELLAAHELSVAAARGTFRKVAVADAEAASYEAELETRVRAAFVKARATNATASEDYCTGVLRSELAAVQPQLDKIGAGGAAPAKKSAGAARVVAKRAPDAGSDSDDSSSSSSLSGIDLGTSSSDDEDGGAAAPVVRSHRSRHAKHGGGKGGKGGAAGIANGDGGKSGRAQDTSTLLHPALEEFWAVIGQVQRSYQDKARGPARGAVLAEWLTSTVPRLQADVMDRLQGVVDGQVAELKATVTKQTRELATARGREQALVESAASQRTAFERQITEGALKASREKERLREQMESKEQELQRNLKQFDTFMTSQSERGKQQDEHIAKLLREAAELREQLGDARDRVEAKVEESLKFAAKAAEAHAARADMTRKLADAQEAMRGNQTDASLLLEKLQAAEDKEASAREQLALLKHNLLTQEQLTDTQGALAESKASEKAELEYKLAESKAKLAQAEGDKLTILEDLYAFQSLAAHMKKVLAQRNQLKYLQLDNMLRRRFDRLPLPES